MYCKKTCKNFLYETGLNQSVYSQANILLSKYIALKSTVVHVVHSSLKKNISKGINFLTNKNKCHNVTLVIKIKIFMSRIH